MSLSLLTNRNARCGRFAEIVLGNCMGNQLGLSPTHLYRNDHKKSRFYPNLFTKRHWNHLYPPHVSLQQQWDILLFGPRCEVSRWSIIWQRTDVDMSSLVHSRGCTKVRLRSYTWGILFRALFFWDVFLGESLFNLVLAFGLV